MSITCQSTPFGSAWCPCCRVADDTRALLLVTGSGWADSLSCLLAIPVARRLRLCRNGARPTFGQRWVGDGVTGVRRDDLRALRGATCLRPAEAMARWGLAGVPGPAPHRGR